MSDATLRWQAQRIEELEATIANMRDERHHDASEDVQLALIKRFRLRPVEARLLEALYTNRSRYARRDWLFGRGGFGSCGGTDPTGKALDVYISRLRKRFGFDSIETIRARGYALTSKGRAMIASAFNRKQGRAA